MLLIKNGKVLTMTGKLYDGADILVDDGIIKDIGTSIDIGGGRSNRIIDATDCFVMPGLIDAQTQLGIQTGNLQYETVNANRRACDEIKFLDPVFNEALKAGVTQTLIAPSGENVVSGLCALCKTDTNSQTMFIKSSAAMKATLSSDGELMGENKRNAVTALLRDEIYAAREYLGARERAKKENEPFMRSAALEAWEPVLNREIPLLIEARFDEDVNTAVRMKKLLNINVIILGAGRADRMFDEMAANQVPLIYTANFSNKEISRLGAIEKAGVEFAISSYAPQSPIGYLSLYSGIAVREGVSLLGALQAVTSVPAKLLGSLERTGTIEVGKDADLAIFDDNPLDVFSNVLFTIVNGSICYEK